MSRALPWLLGLGLLGSGFGAGLAVRAHAAQEAEDRAHRADSLYRVAKAGEVEAVKDRAAADAARAVALHAADSTQQAAEDSLAAVKKAAGVTRARASTALATAATLRDTSDTYRGLYEEASTQRDRAIASAESYAASVAKLRIVVAQDSVEIRKERARTQRWISTADSLALANKKLMENRRPGFDLKLGVGGFAVGAAVGALACALAC